MGGALHAVDGLREATQCGAFGRDCSVSGGGKLSGDGVLLGVLLDDNFDAVLEVLNCDVERVARAGRECVKAKLLKGGD